MWRVPRGSAASVEALGDEFDRADVVAAVPEHPAERVVEMVYVGAAETALRVPETQFALLHAASLYS